MVLEKSITNKILRYLNSCHRVHAVKVHQSRYGSGQADISGVAHGRAFQIEVKVPGRSATDLQLKCLRDWRNGGALAFIATSVDEVIEYFGDAGIELDQTKT